MAIDYSVYKKDLQQIATDRRLSITEQSCNVLAPTLEAEVTQAQEAYDVFIATLVGYSIDTAIGVQLDTIGRIVGIERPYVPADELVYFTPDDVTEGLTDLNLVFTTNAPFNVEVLASDPVYRVYIRAKILKNHLQGGTIPELVVFVSILFNINSYVLKNPDQAITLVLQGPVSSATLALLLSKIDNDRFSFDYFLPIDTGTKLGIITAFGDTLIPDDPTRFTDRDLTTIEFF